MVGKQGLAAVVESLLEVRAEVAQLDEWLKQVEKLAKVMDDFEGSLSSGALTAFVASPGWNGGRRVLLQYRTKLCVLFRDARKSECALQDSLDFLVPVGSIIVQEGSFIVQHIAGEFASIERVAANDAA